MKNIKLNKHLVAELVRRGVRVTLAGATLAFTLIMSTGCTEEELNQANEIIEQLQQGGQEEITPEVKPVEPVEQDPIEVEPIEQEPEEINPRDYKAVYGFDFDIPIYTEEEVAEANERLQENYEYLEKIENGSRDEDVLNMVGKDYYISRQEMIYKQIASLENVECEKIMGIHKNYVYYLDESTQWLYQIHSGYIMVIGKDSNEEYFMIDVRTDDKKKNNDRVIGEYDKGNMLNVGNHSHISVTSNNRIADIYNMDLDEMSEKPYLIVTEEKFIENGFINIGNDINDQLIK